VFASRSSARRSGSRPRRGFTLVESLIALTIVGLAAVSAVAAFGTELRTAERARRGLEAAALAEERLTMLELLPTHTLGRLPDSLSRGRLAPRPVLSGERPCASTPARARIGAAEGR
jgi:prepilin-type N-terminal cleavage/methylation domain-containing protein